MNKKEYLEILSDYLKQYFNLEQQQEILRDMEEYFFDGVSSGKSEWELIQGLGSPKQLAQELKEQAALKSISNENVNSGLSSLPLPLRSGQFF